jgi:hypothetical protein
LFPLMSAIPMSGGIFPLFYKQGFPHMTLQISYYRTDGLT